MQGKWQVTTNGTESCLVTFDAEANLGGTYSATLRVVAATSMPALPVVGLWVLLLLLGVGGVAAAARSS